jgi:formiminotetrahydrofolate cyclodeaminase
MVANFLHTKKAGTSAGRNFQAGPKRANDKDELLKSVDEDTRAFNRSWKFSFKNSDEEKDS